VSHKDFSLQGLIVMPESLEAHPGLVLPSNERKSTAASSVEAVIIVYWQMFLFTTCFFQCWAM